MEPPVLVESKAFAITAKELKTYDITHLRMGDGYVMAHDFGDEFCLLTPIGPDFGVRAYLAWKPILSVSSREGKPIMAKYQSQLGELREGLANGSLKVVETHIQSNSIEL